MVAAVLVAPLAIQGYSAGVANPAATVRRVVSETMLAPVGGLMGRLTERIRISPDGRHVAFVTAAPSGARVYLDGKAGPGPYTLISDPQFSPNSARLAYAATMNDRSPLVLDGVEGSWYDAVSNPLFSPNSARIAYAVFTRMPAPVGRKSQVVIDGSPSAPFEAFTDPYITFSPDSRRVAYVYGATADQAVTVLDGQPVSLPGYDSIVAEFFPNGVAYRARKGGKSFFLLINGREVAGPYRQIGFLTFSPDGKRTAYSMMEDACVVCSQRAVVDGAVGPPYFAVGNKVIFSPDGTRWAYQALKRPYSGVVVLDGREYAQGSDPVFSPDSRRIGFLRQSRTPPGIAAIVDRQEGRPYRLIRQLVFSPDSQHFAYGADRGQNLLLVVDGSERKEYPRAADSTPLVIPTFSPDSRHVLYIAPVGNDHAVVVDENEGNRYDKIMSKIVFDSPTRFHYIARKISGFYLVEEDLVEIDH